MPYIEGRDGVKIYYEEKGEGNPILFLHGWCMSRRVWFYQQELAERFRLIFLDLRGHGRSSTPASGYSFADFAADLPAVFDQLQLHDVILVGWSMGAQVALKAVEVDARRLAGLVLMGGTPKFVAAADYPHGLPEKEIRGMGLRLRRNYEATIQDFGRRMFIPRELSVENFRSIHRNVIRDIRYPELHVALEALRSLETEDLRAILPHVALPTLLIHGDEDSICLPAASRFMAGRIPGGRLALIEKSGHAPFISRPSQVNDLLSGFARQVHDAPIN